MTPEYQLRAQQTNLDKHYMTCVGIAEDSNLDEKAAKKLQDSALKLLLDFQSTLDPKTEYQNSRIRWENPYVCRYRQYMGVISWAHRPADYPHHIWTINQVIPRSLTNKVGAAGTTSPTQWNSSYSKSEFPDYDKKLSLVYAQHNMENWLVEHAGAPPLLNARFSAVSDSVQSMAQKEILSMDHPSPPDEAFGSLGRHAKELIAAAMAAAAGSGTSADAPSSGAAAADGTSDHD